MKRVLICLAALGVCMAVMPRSSAAAPYATGSLKEAVYELPNDSGKLYLTVAGSTNDQKYKDLTGQFSATPEWKEIRDTAHYTQLPTNSTMFKSRYAKEYKDFPTIRLQTADGRVVNEWVGRSIPANDELMSELKADCFRRFRQQKQQSAPIKEVDQEIKQPLDNAPAPVTEDWPSWKLLVAAALVGALLAAWSDWSRLRSEK